MTAAVVVLSLALLAVAAHAALLHLSVRRMGGLFWQLYEANADRVERLEAMLTEDDWRRRP
jgi:hypothetical protein